MALEIEFVTLGDASKRIDVPSPTLRHWTDQLEEFETHYVMRNNRNERLYNEDDIKIFEFLRDLKEEYGRRTSTRDLAYMIAERGEQGDFVLRTKEDAPMPTPNPSNKTADLLNQEDIQRLMQSERVKQFIDIVISRTQKDMREEIVEEVRASMREEMEEYDKRAEERMKKMESVLQQRAEQTEKWITQMREGQEQLKLEHQEEKEQIIEEQKNKSFWQRLMGK